MASLGKGPFARFSELTFMTTKRSISMSFSAWICARRKVKVKVKVKVEVKLKSKFKFKLK